MIKNQNLTEEEKSRVDILFSHYQLFRHPHAENRDEPLMNFIKSKERKPIKISTLKTLQLIITRRGQKNKDKRKCFDKFDINEESGSEKKISFFF